MESNFGSILPMESDLLETDIASGSYNFIRQGTAQGGNTKLLLRNDVADCKNLVFTNKLHDLEACPKRCKCSNCDGYFKYFCYDCRIPLPCTLGILPKLNLPMFIDIVKHGCEANSKVCISISFFIIFTPNCSMLGKSLNPSLRTLR